MHQTASPEKGWLSTTSKILYERPERLQQLVMQIGTQNPEMGCYASDLARLRMSGLVMENMLFLLWKADTPTHIDTIISQFNKLEHPCAGAIIVMANLVKSHITLKEHRQATTH